MTELYTGHLGGWREDVEDRSFLRSFPVAACMAPANPRKSFDPHTIPGFHILDQMQQGACAGHMRANMLGYLNWLETGTWVDYCRQFSYITGQMESKDQRHPNGLIGSDIGATISGQMKAAVKYGTCREGQWPYSGAYDTRIPQRCYDEAKNHKLASFIDLRAYARMMAFNQGFHGPIGIGIDWGGCQIVDGYRIVSYRPATDPRNRKGHAVTLFGWDDELADSDGPSAWLINSWTERAGKRGKYLLYAKAYSQMCQDPCFEGFGASKQQDIYSPTVNPQRIA